MHKNVNSIPYTELLKGNVIMQLQLLTVHLLPFNVLSDISTITALYMHKM